MFCERCGDYQQIGDSHTNDQCMIVGDHVRWEHRGGFVEGEILSRTKNCLGTWAVEIKIITCSSAFAFYDDKIASLYVGEEVEMKRIVGGE